MPERRSMRKVCPLLLLIACLGFFPTAWGQEVTATVTGSVVDPAGASIVGATITAKDKERETTSAVQANSTGVYQIPRLPIGTYELTVRAPGFQTAIYRSITLVLNQIARVDFQLKIGQATETVDVTSTPPLLNTDTTQLSTVLDALETCYPVLRGTIRDQMTGQRRPFVRFFAGKEDLSHHPPDSAFPEAVASGGEPFLVIGAMAGG